MTVDRPSNPAKLMFAGSDCDRRPFTSAGVLVSAGGLNRIAASSRLLLPVTEAML